MISEDRIRELAGHRTSNVVTSCYLDVDGRRQVRPADYETQLDHLLREAREKAAGFGPEAARSVAADLDRIAAWVRSGFDRSRVRGLAFFACSADGFFDVVESPLPVRNGVVVNHTPHVRPLESILQAYERFAVVLVDRQRARLFRFELGELTEHAEVFDAVPRGGDQAGHPAAGADGVAQPLDQRRLAPAGQRRLHAQRRLAHLLGPGGGRDRQPVGDPFPDPGVEEALELRHHLVGAAQDHMVDGPLLQLGERHLGGVLQVPVGDLVAVALHGRAPAPLRRMAVLVTAPGRGVE